MLAACGFAAAGALGALTAKDWTDAILSAVSGDLVRDIRFDIVATSVSGEINVQNNCLYRVHINANIGR